MVYVDTLFQTAPSLLWPYRQACHLMADSEQELHTFAQRLGLRRAWFQPRSHPHYDLTPSKRRRATVLGAKETTPATLLALTQAAKDSAHALNLWQAYIYEVPT